MKDCIYPSKGFTKTCNKELGMGSDLKVIVKAKLAKWILKSEEKTIISINSNEGDGWPGSFILKMFLYPRFLLLCLTANSYGYKINIIYSAEMNIVFTKKNSNEAHNNSLKPGTPQSSAPYLKR